ncbi:hypothetical protein L208DRAFT_145370 [Tricholoma matsutake]|nr:hypothetical protein L208DRAFT_145370 [Tricholoma matsutake 945]
MVVRLVTPTFRQRRNRWANFFLGYGALGAVVRYVYFCTTEKAESKFPIFLILRVKMLLLARGFALDGSNHCRSRGSHTGPGTRLVLKSVTDASQ